MPGQHPADLPVDAIAINGPPRGCEAALQPIEVRAQTFGEATDNGLVLLLARLRSAQDVGLVAIAAGAQLHLDVVPDPLPVLGIDQLLLETPQIGPTRSDHVAATARA